MAGFAGVLSGSNYFKAQGFSTDGLSCVVGGKNELLFPAFLKEKCTIEMDRIESLHHRGHGKGRPVEH